MSFFYKSTDDGYIIPSFSCNGTNYIYFLYALFFFAVPSFLSCLSPGGLFSNCLQGIGFTSECDPGGFYIPSAHQIFEADGKNIFMGHPGITLQFILAIIQVLYFKIANTQNLSYSQFLAFNLDNLYLISKILMSLINVGVIFLFFRTAKLFGLSQFGSFAASLGYVTCPGLFGPAES